MGQNHSRNSILESTDEVRVHNKIDHQQHCLEDSRTSSTAVTEWSYSTDSASHASHDSRSSRSSRSSTGTCQSSTLSRKKYNARDNLHTFMEEQQLEQQQHQQRQGRSIFPHHHQPLQQRRSSPSHRLHPRPCMIQTIQEERGGWGYFVDTS